MSEINLHCRIITWHHTNSLTDQLLLVTHYHIHVFSLKNKQPCFILGVIYILAGDSSDVDAFDVSSGSWSKMPPMLDSRRGGAVAVLPSSEQIVVCGGNGLTCEIFDKRANK